MRNKDYTYITIAELIANQNSTCCKRKVGAILVKEGHGVSTGFNGSVSGAEHCEDHFFNLYLKEGPSIPFKDWLKSDRIRKLHKIFQYKYEPHAEINAINFAAKMGISTEGTELYVSSSPCFNCAKTIIQSGIKSVYFSKVYESERGAIDYLRENNIFVKQVGK